MHSWTSQIQPVYTVFIIWCEKLFGVSHKLLFPKPIFSLVFSWKRPWILIFFLPLLLKRVFKASDKESACAVNIRKWNYRESVHHSCFFYCFVLSVPQRKVIFNTGKLFTQSCIFKFSSATYKNGLTVKNPDKLIYMGCLQKRTSPISMSGVIFSFHEHT